MTSCSILRASLLVSICIKGEVVYFNLPIIIIILDNEGRAGPKKERKGCLSKNMLIKDIV